MAELSPPTPSPPPKSSWKSLSLTMLLAMLMGGLFLALPMGLVAPGLLLLIVLLSLLMAFHYFVWGRWMTRILQQEQENQEQETP